MSWQDWRDNEAVWRPAVDAILSAARQYSAEHPEMQIGIVPIAWDTPDVELHWHGGALSRNLHITLEGVRWPLTLRYVGAVWKDDPAGRDFRSYDWGAVTAPDMGGLEAALPSDIAEAVRHTENLPLRASLSASAD